MSEHPKVQFQVCVHRIARVGTVLRFNLKYLPKEVAPGGICSFYRYHGREENYIITYWSRTEVELAQQQTAV